MWGSGSARIHIADDIYFKLTGAHLKPVLDTLLYLKHETHVWLEITNLLIPGLSDSDEELTELSQWVSRELGPDVPLPFSAFHPAHKMLDTPPTPTESLHRARKIANDAGLHFVYLGNVHDADGDTTFCPHCHAPLVVRDWYEIKRHAVAQGGFCPGCGTAIAGRFDGRVGDFGRRRMPVAIEQ